MKRTWRERVNAAIETGRFTPSDNYAVRSWHSCAVGERGHIPIGRVNMEDFEDWPLACRLGGEFAIAVLHNEMEDASGLLTCIEALKLKEAS